MPLKVTMTSFNAAWNEDKSYHYVPNILLRKELYVALPVTAPVFEGLVRTVFT